MIINGRKSVVNGKNTQKTVQEEPVLNKNEVFAK
jgi:hypothetical protein